MERRYLSLVSAPIRLESRVGSDYPYIVGTAAPFFNAADSGTEYTLWDYGDNDRCVERIMQTAFDEVLKAGLPDCAALFNHDPNNLLGRVRADTLKLTKGGQGLQYSIWPPDAPLSQGVIANIKAGNLYGSSFSFTVDKAGQRWIEQGGFVVREIHSVSGLFDVGPVTFPAYSASTAGTRADRGEGDGATEARKAYDAWRASAEGLRSAKASQAMARAKLIQLEMDRNR